MTIDDVRELTKYAAPRRLRTENYQWRTMGNIIRAAAFYEKGGDKQFNQFMDNFKDRDESYTERPFDASALEGLAATVQANRAKR